MRHVSDVLYFALQDQLNAANDSLLERKKLQTEQDKILELRVIEYQKAKAEREAAFEREQVCLIAFTSLHFSSGYIYMCVPGVLQEKIRIEKERETARLRGLQEKAQDDQAARDALRAKRAAEQAEREWRRKESDEMRKKVFVEEGLKQARTQQMVQKEHFMAVQAQRERNDFERVLR